MSISILSAFVPAHHPISFPFAYRTIPVVSSQRAVAQTIKGLMRSFATLRMTRILTMMIVILNEVKNLVSSHITYEYLGNSPSMSSKNLRRDWLLRRRFLNVVFLEKGDIIEGRLLRSFQHGHVAAIRHDNGL
jgi:hypothetical protein